MRDVERIFNLNRNFQELWTRFLARLMDEKVAYIYICTYDVWHRYRKSGRTSARFAPAGVLARSILHERTISFARESNESPGEFLHPRTCATEKVSPTWPRGLAIYLAARKAGLRHRSRGMVSRTVRHGFQLPPLGIALVSSWLDSGIFLRQRADWIPKSRYWYSVGSVWTRVPIIFENGPHPVGLWYL